MLNSMTGFGSRQGQVPAVGKISVELRSSNHKFLDIVFHLPEALLSLEDRLKRIIESRIKRGRITCVINVMRLQGTGVFINKALLKSYILSLKDIKHQFKIDDGMRLDTLINLPGVLSLAESSVSADKVAPRLEGLTARALEDLLKMRQREGRALYGYLKRRAQAIGGNLAMVKAKFKKLIQQKLSEFDTDDAAASFLKDTDITEELERLSFHIKNFKNKILKSSSIGKELDFIAQEMQREANTIGAKSCSAVISARIVQIKSQIEKIREQVQNIE